MLCAILAPSVVPLAQTHGMPWVDGVLMEISEIVSIPKAHAQSNIGNTVSNFFGTLLEVFTVLNWLVLGMVQKVLNPDFIFGENMAGNVRPMEPVLNKIWMISRDIVNAIFAFLLIVGAIMVILQGKMEMIKTKAPMFVIAVILVNFSWFVPRVILDMANVLQSVVYQLPSMVSPQAKCINGVDLGADGQPGGDGDDADSAIPCNFVWKVNIFPTPADKCRAPDCIRPTEGGDFPNRGKQIGNLVDIYFADWGNVIREGGYTYRGQFYPVSGADTVLNGLAVNFAKLPNLSRITFAQAQDVSARSGPMGKAQAYMKYVVMLVFHGILSVAIGLLLLAMLAVFIVRIGVIWMCVAFMPFVFLGVAMRGSISSIGEIPGAEFNIWKEFVKYAFLPAMVAVPLAVGFTLLSQAPTIGWYAADTNVYRIEGIPKVLGVSTFHELLWLAITLGIMWIFTFKVIEKSDSIASKFTMGVKNMGQGAMKFGMNAVGYAPVLPMPGGGKGSFFGARDAVTRAGFGSPYTAGKPLDFMAGAAGGGAGAAPMPTDQIQRAVTDQKDDPGFKRAIDELKNHQNKNNEQLTDSLRKLASALEQSGHIGRGGAQSVFTDQRVLQDVLSKSKEHGLVDDAQATAIAGAFHPVINDLRASLPKVNLQGGGATLNQKFVAERTIQALDSSSMPDIKKALEAHKNIQASAQSQTAINEVLQKIDAAITNNTNVDALKNDLGTL